MAQELKPDTSSIWSLQDENASISTSSPSDRLYVNGLQLGYVGGTDDVPAFLDRAGKALWRSGQVRLGIQITQQLFTPFDTSTPKVQPNDRPYAGTLLGNFYLQRDVQDSRSLIGLAVGVVGPGSGAASLQQGWHNLIGQTSPKGWSDQLQNEPLFEFTSARTYRLSTGKVFGLETDALPELAVGLGNLMVYGQTGVAVRIGQGLDSDYGPPRLFYGPTGGTAFRPTRPVAWYLYGGVDGNGIAHNLTLNGSMWSSSPSVKINPLVGEAYVGLAVMVFGARLTYTQVFQSQEFNHQKGGVHEFGSLALSVRF
jgi:hypothetical protein